MKKILNEWKIFLKENSRFESVDKDALLDKVRDIFFGSYNTFDSEYRTARQKIRFLYSDLEVNVKYKTL